VPTPKDIRQDDDELVLIAAGLLNALAVIKGRAQLLHRHARRPAGVERDEMLVGLRHIDDCTGRIQLLFQTYQEAAARQKSGNGRESLRRAAESGRPAEHQDDSSASASPNPR